MPSLNALADGWGAVAPAAGMLEQAQRDWGDSAPVLTAAEMRQLCLLLQRFTANMLATDQLVRGEQQAVALLQTSLRASRKLCELQPGRAAYMLQMADDLAGLQIDGPSPTRQELEAYQAALEAATAEHGAGWDLWAGQEELASLVGGSPGVSTHQIGCHAMPCHADRIPLRIHTHMPCMPPTHACLQHTLWRLRPSGDCHAPSCVGLQAPASPWRRRKSCRSVHSRSCGYASPGCPPDVTRCTKAQSLPTGQPWAVQQ